MEGKIWGKTCCLFDQQNVSVHEIKIVRGGYCSRHKHRAKYNVFYILSGRLQVKIWRDALCDTTVLTAGEQLTVAPGELHEFEALDATHALEIYYTELNHNDIERDTTGGIRQY